MSAPKPPVTTTTSIKPAATVLGIAVFVLIFFTSINILANPTVQSTTTIPIIVGALPIDASSKLLRVCQLPDNPPTDISAVLLVPTNSSTISSPKWRGQGPGGFDCSRTLTTMASPGDVLGFYKSHAQARGWKLFSSGSSYHGNKSQLLFQKSGSDTFYWIFGITMESQTNTTATYTVRLYQGASLI